MEAKPCAVLAGEPNAGAAARIRLLPLPPGRAAEAAEHSSFDSTPMVWCVRSCCVVCVAKKEIDTRTIEAWCLARWVSPQHRSCRLRNNQRVDVCCLIAVLDRRTS